MNAERICYGCFQEKEPGSICPHCGFDEKDEQPYLALPLGTIVNGRYLIGKVLGIGGFGITYLGYDLTLEIKVAIKEYMPSSLATRHADHYSVALTGRVEQDFRNGMEKFLDEAKILAKLQNTPHVVSVQNYFKENNTAYFVMEYIDGMSLKDYLAKQGGKIPCAQALTILQPIMEALAQVHAMNLLHRDISPDNIYITSQGESRLLDFGAARFALGDGKSVSVILKHGYAPEEQYSSHGNQGPWTDVYAMGATMYRCITGVLPPDSVERIHGDTLKRPSELGVPIPAHVENALFKALSMKTEDRFPNMEAFLGALTGRISVQDQVAASIRQRTQATAYSQPVYGNTAAQQAKVVSAFSRFLTYMKANPIIAWISGGGLVAVIALCIILPIALSGGGKDTPADGGDGAVISQQPPFTTQPDTSDMVERDLGVLNATISIPSDYEASQNGLSFVNSDAQIIVMTDYIWNAGAPIYTLADVETNREAIVDQFMQTMEVADYSIITAGPDQVGAADAYQIFFEGSDSEGSMEFVMMAVEGSDNFGCYMMTAGYAKGDEAAKGKVNSMVRSFRSNGPVDVTYGMYYAEGGGVKVIVDKALVLGGAYDMEVQMNVNGIGTVHEMMLYPTEADRDAEIGQGYAVEIGKASEFNCSTPADVIQYNKNISGTNNETYTFSAGGAEWLAYDFALNGKYFSCASAVIGGECFFVSCMYSDSNEDTMITLYNQAIASVRAWNGT